MNLHYTLFARKIVVIGHAILPALLEYDPNPYIEASNERLSYDSLYQYQLQQRR